MGYPGDQSQSGGWPPEQPSQSSSPYGLGSGADQGLSAARHDQNPFSPPPNGPPTGDGQRSADPGAGSYDPYGSPDRGGDRNPYTFPADPGAPYQPAAPGGPGGDSYGSSPYPGPDYGGAAGAHQGSYEHGHADHDPDRGRPLPPKRSKKPLIIGAAVGAVVLVGGGIAAVSVLGGDPEKKTTAGAAPSGAVSPEGSGASSPPATPTTQPTPTTTPLGLKLKSRATDPRPLSLREVFKHQRFGRYAMTVKRQDASCVKVVHGAAFAAALKAGGCNQLLRATFATTDGKLVGTIGVANLKTEAAAKKVQKAGSGKNAWMLPLQGSGLTKKIGTGSALGTAETRGHYVLLSWVQRPDGKDLTAKQRSTVSTFVTQVIFGSNLTPALQYRGISGKPYGT